jgi:2-polyprenyl-3-methyl-5-hydroxy-6-metoxy-1,4-benzoquinol methylase
MGEIQRISPKSVLDLGVGFGKWGVLCREILDARFGRCRPDQWEAKIIGYECWSAYKNPVWSVYDGVFEKPIELRSSFDLVLMIDSLEHFEPEAGRKFLRDIVEINGDVIVSVPNGRMEQGETFGNPHEAHLWTFNGTTEFEAYNFNLIHQSVCTVVSIEGFKA